MRENIGKLHELADYLLEKETITGEEFMGILNNGKNLPGKEVTGFTPAIKPAPAV